MTTTRSLLLSLLLLALATPAVRADDDALPFEWAGAWQTDAGATRVVERIDEGRGHLARVEWTADRGPVRLQGAGSGGTLALAGRRPGAVGMVKRIQGDQSPPPADAMVRVVAVRQADDEVGRWVADVQVLDGQATTRERWTRLAPTRLELVSCSVADGWNPKSRPLTLEYRLRGAPARLRLRVLVASARSGASALVGDRRQAAYEALATRDGDELVVHEAPLGAGELVKAGSYTAAWDGRDDTDAKRLVHGGRLLLVVEALQAPDVKRAERALEVAAPITKLVAPNWPKNPVNPAAPHRPRDMGRDRAGLHRDVQTGAAKLGFSGPDAHQPTATPADFLAALQTSAVVFVATHGDTGSINLYTTATDEERVADHEKEAKWSDVDNLGTAVRKEHAGTTATKRFRDDPTPLRDLHTVVIWACLAGRQILPETLIERGCDNVVGFSESIDASGSDFFYQRLLEALLLGAPGVADRQPLSVSEASRVAAAFATHQIWDHTRHQLERDRRERNEKNKGVAGWVPFSKAAPYTDCLVTYTAKGADGADTHLEVARWGNSTNATQYVRSALEPAEFTGGTGPSPSEPKTDSPKK